MPIYTAATNSPSSEPHASLGYVKFYFDWDWPGAEVEFRRAIMLDPSWAAAHQWYCILLPAAGRAREAAHEIEFARERDPLSLAINTDPGFHYYYTCQYCTIEVIKQLQSVLGMNRNFAPARSWLDRSYVQIGRFDNAITEFRGVEQSVSEWPVAIAGRRLRLDLRFDGLRADPRFSELLDQIKFLQCER